MRVTGEEATFRNTRDLDLPSTVGGCAGLLAALILVRFMRSILVQVGPYDPKIPLTVTAVLSAVVLMACLIPALRAAKVHPMAALKNE
jgi:ABC-type antimicrobial peptide transport system permease subunit